MTTDSPTTDRWDEVRRVEQWAGEVRVNLIRLTGIVLFYGRHLADYALAPADSPTLSTSSIVSFATRGRYH